MRGTGQKKLSGDDERVRLCHGMVLNGVCSKETNFSSFSDLFNSVTVSVTDVGYAEVKPEEARSHSTTLLSVKKDGKPAVGLQRILMLYVALTGCGQGDAHSCRIFWQAPASWEASVRQGKGCFSNCKVSVGYNTSFASS